MPDLPEVSQDLIRALRRGDVVGILSAAKAQNDMPPEEYLGRLLLEYRRQNVAVLGSHEAFVRRRSDGFLQGIIEPVRVSVTNGDVYQLAMKRPYIRRDGTLERFFGRTKGRTDIEWIDENRHKGMLTYQGFQRVNAVAGCSLPQPATITVDGEKRTNPYVQRMERPDGRPGDVVRVVVGVVVIGPAPATGNLVAVSYVLDYDPARDLQHMLAEVADKHPQVCKLVAESDPQTREPGWHYVDIYGGVGYCFDLTVDEIAKVYRKFINMMQHAEKKAQTVARRNAMRSHPALGGFAHVTVDDHGRAVLPVRGWTMSPENEEQWVEITRALERGRPLPELAEVLDVEVEEIAEEYDPEAEEAQVDPEGNVEAPEDGAAPLDRENEEARRLRHLIEQGLDVLGPDAGTFGYAPTGEHTEEELADILSAVNAEVDNLE